MTKSQHAKERSSTSFDVDPVFLELANIIFTLSHTATSTVFSSSASKIGVTL